MGANIHIPAMVGHISENIRELMHAFKHQGRIGRSRPPSPGKAVKQAAAIAYRKARESGPIPGTDRPA